MGDFPPLDDRAKIPITRNLKCGFEGCGIQETRSGSLIETPPASRARSPSTSLFGGIAFLWAFSTPQKSILFERSKGLSKCMKLGSSPGFRQRYFPRRFFSPPIFSPPRFFRSRAFSPPISPKNPNSKTKPQSIRKTTKPPHATNTNTERKGPGSNAQQHWADEATAHDQKWHLTQTSGKINETAENSSLSQRGAKDHSAASANPRALHVGHLAVLASGAVEVSSDFVALRVELDGGCAITSRSDRGGGAVIATIAGRVADGGDIARMARGVTRNPT